MRHLSNGVYLRFLGVLSLLLAGASASQAQSRWRLAIGADSVPREGSRAYVGVGYEEQGKWLLANGASYCDARFATSGVRCSNVAIVGDELPARSTSTILVLDIPETVGVFLVEQLTRGDRPCERRFSSCKATFSALMATALREARYPTGSCDASDLAPVRFLACVRGNK